MRNKKEDVRAREEETCDAVNRKRGRQWEKGIHE